MAAKNCLFVVCCYTDALNVVKLDVYILKRSILTEIKYLDPLQVSSAATLVIRTW